MRNLFNCIRWLCALGVLCVSFSLAVAETDQKLVARIDVAVAKAAKFLASKQSPDGAWRSDVYAPFKEGDTLTPLVMTALLPLPIDDTTEPVCDRGMQYLAELSKRTFENPDGLKSLAYPVYTAANITIALHQNRRGEDEAIRAKWIQALRDLQLTEATGWNPEDVEYGGWTYGHTAAKKPAETEALGNLDQPNLSASAFALVALGTSGTSVHDAAMQRGLKFVSLLQNGDGGFFFIHDDKVRNKAGVDASGVGEFRSYGSTTADGLRSLIACGAGSTDSASAARKWLSSHLEPSMHPGKYSEDRKGAQNALYYYWAASMSQALRVQSHERSEGNAWAADLADSLIAKQLAEGGWRNPAVDQREDDPIIATSFALQALTTCRLMLSSDERSLANGQVGHNLTCHARDAKCHGEKLQYEPQPQKHTLGFWVNAADYATWKIAVEKPGEYEVVVWQGCGAGQGGSEVAIGIGDQVVKFTVDETGHFQHFKKRSVGRLKLPAGEQELTLKALKKAKGAVADVRQIRLIPVASAE